MDPSLEAMSYTRVHQFQSELRKSVLDNNTIYFTVKFDKFFKMFWFDSHRLVNIYALQEEMQTPDNVWLRAWSMGVRDLWWSLVDAMSDWWSQSE